MNEWIKKNALLAALLALIVLAILVSIFKHYQQIRQMALPPVAVPAGFTPEQGFLLSVEDYEAAYALGYRRFLVHLNFTSDNKIVCIRNWDESANVFAPEQPNLMNAVQSKKILSYDEFTTRAVRTDKRPCTLETIAGWLNQKPDASIIVMMHARPKIGFEMIKQAIPKFAAQILPEVDNPQQYKAMKAMGYENIIFKFQPDQLKPKQLEKIKEFISNTNVYAVHLPSGFKDKPTSPPWIAKNKIPTYIAGVENCNQYNNLRKKGFGGMYAKPGLQEVCS